MGIANSVCPLNPCFSFTIRYGFWLYLQPVVLLTSFYDYLLLYLSLFFSQSVIFLLTFFSTCGYRLSLSFCLSTLRIVNHVHIYLMLLPPIQKLKSSSFSCLNEYMPFSLTITYLFSHFNLCWDFLQMRPWMKPQFFVCTPLRIIGLMGNSGVNHSVDLRFGYSCFSFFKIILAKVRQGRGSREESPEEGDSGHGINDGEQASFGSESRSTGYLCEKLKVSLFSIVNFMVFSFYTFLVSLYWLELSLQLLNSIFYIFNSSALSSDATDGNILIFNIFDIQSPIGPIAIFVLLILSQPFSLFLLLAKNQQVVAILIFFWNSLYHGGQFCSYYFYYYACFFTLSRVFSVFFLFSYFECFALSSFQLTSQLKINSALVSRLSSVICQLSQFYDSLLPPKVLNTGLLFLCIFLAMVNQLDMASLCSPSDF